MADPQRRKSEPRRDSDPKRVNKVVVDNTLDNIGIETEYVVTVNFLGMLNVSQSANDNKLHLDDHGGPECLAKNMQVNLETGLLNEQVAAQLRIFGANFFPDSPMDSYWTLLLEALSDSTLLILVAAAIVSLVIGIYQDPVVGWVEGAAILIAVFAVSSISAGNDYSKQLQFRSLEKASAKDEQVSILRDGNVDRHPVGGVVVGDVVVLTTGDMVPADCIIVDNSVVVVNEASLTGEGDDLKKSKAEDCFLLSSCLVVEGDEVRALVIAVGKYSQWGKIKENLRVSTDNTPLQDKLEEMTKQIGYVGMAFAFLTFIAKLVSIWTRGNGQNVAAGVIEAFIMAVTIVVVAIPEGLPLAVTIALAFSTRKMYSDMCFIRVLAACETMGNATNICSDKTGTLTENSMTVVEGWFADVFYKEVDDVAGKASRIPDKIKNLISENVSVNRIAYLSHIDKMGNPLTTPSVVGSKTEGALLLMIDSWHYDYEQIKLEIFEDVRDVLFGFNSVKKRSTCIVTRKDKSVRLFCKGASELLLQDCSMYTSNNGVVFPMTESKMAELEGIIQEMASRALRTLVIAHVDFSSVSDMPSDWREMPPDDQGLCVDAIVGIMDPLRPDVADAVKEAQSAGVFVRMVTGDNINTAIAIAKKCGILTPNGLAIEGPVFRKMTPAELDLILPRLQVMARSSPDDKMLLVMRLNGHNLPKNRDEWLLKMHDQYGRYELKWETDRDFVLPGHYDEWKATRPDGGQVVSVTGDGTNDAPALKAADVGLAMGITGTKVAQGAADIVILDDRFSSIVRAIMWGRSVYDNIRKFLQFQLTVNVVALILVFVSAVSGATEPITAVQMLWVNLVMDTLGALALGTEAPTSHLLLRRPYKRNSNLVSRPMMRNIICQAILMCAICFYLVYGGAQLFGIRSGSYCEVYQVGSDRSTWTLSGMSRSNGTIGGADSNADLSCSSFQAYCPHLDIDCLEATHSARSGTVRPSQVGTHFAFTHLPGYESTCLKCLVENYTHGTIIFNTFIFCQIFNEYASRMILDELNVFAGLSNNPMFIYVSIASVFMQVFIVEVCGGFMKTTPLTLNQWLATMGLGALVLVMSVFMRFIPVTEEEDAFFDATSQIADDGNSLSRKKKSNSSNNTKSNKNDTSSKGTKDEEEFDVMRALEELDEEEEQEALEAARSAESYPKLLGNGMYCITADSIVMLTSTAISAGANARASVIASAGVSAKKGRHADSKTTANTGTPSTNTTANTNTNTNTNSSAADTPGSDRQTD